MQFSVQPQDRTTLYRLIFLELARYVVLVLTWWVFTPSALRRLGERISCSLNGL